LLASWVNLVFETVVSGQQTYCQLISSWTLLISLETIF
jgi:hypothetical protein